MGKTRGLQHKGRGFEFGFGDVWWGSSVIRFLKNGPAAVKLMASELDGNVIIPKSYLKTRLIIQLN